MKTKCLLFIVGIILSTLVYSQNEVCPSNNINTNPGNALNANAPDPKFINEFNWFAELVNELLDVSIHNLTDYYPISSMLNPYDAENDLCFYLANANLNDLDIKPEEGWELLFINLGYYPDLTLLASVSESSANPNMPYLMLYNKYRGIIRVFANAKFIDPSYSEVEISLQFDPDAQLNVSGLFRYNAGVDRTLDQTTEVAGAKSYAKLPANADEWFHVDFQVAYDPCTCLYDSRLQLVLKPISSTQIEITNSDFPDINIDLQNNNGLDQASAIIPNGAGLQPVPSLAWAFSPVFYSSTLIHISNE